MLNAVEERAKAKSRRESEDAQTGANWQNPWQKQRFDFDRLKPIAVIFVVLTFVWYCWRYGSWDKPDPDKSPPIIDVSTAMPDYTLSATELGEAYSLLTGSPAIGDKKYLGKVLVVHGKIAFVFMEASWNIILDGGNKGLSIKCWISNESKFLLPKLKEGQIVTVKGVCEGLGVEVVMNDCIIMK